MSKISNTGHCDVGGLDGAITLYKISGTRWVANYFAATFFCCLHATVDAVLMKYSCIGNRELKKPRRRRKRHLEMNI